MINKTDSELNVKCLCYFQNAKSLWKYCANMHLINLMHSSCSPNKAKQGQGGNSTWNLCGVQNFVQCLFTVRFKDKAYILTNVNRKNK